MSASSPVNQSNQSEQYQYSPTAEQIYNTPVTIPEDRPFARHLRAKDFPNKADRHNRCGDHIRMVCEKGHVYRSPRLTCGLRFCPFCGAKIIERIINSIINANAFPGYLSTAILKWSKPIDRSDLPQAREDIRSAFDLATRTARLTLKKEYPMLWHGEMWHRDHFQMKVLISHGEDNPECSPDIHALFDKLAKRGFKLVKFLHLKPRDNKNRKMIDMLHKFFFPWWEEPPTIEQRAEDEVLFDTIRLTRFYHCPHDERDDDSTPGEKDLSVKDSTNPHTDNSHVHSHKHDWRICPECGGTPKTSEYIDEYAREERYRHDTQAALDRMEALGPPPSD